MPPLRVKGPDSRPALTEFICEFTRRFRLVRVRLVQTTARVRFWVRDGPRILARVLSSVDARPNAHWQERLGHLCLDTREAVRLLMDEACG